MKRLDESNDLNKGINLKQKLNLILSLNASIFLPLGKRMVKS